MPLPPPLRSAQWPVLFTPSRFEGSEAELPPAEVARGFMPRDLPTPPRLSSRTLACEAVRDLHVYMPGLASACFPRPPAQPSGPCHWDSLPAPFCR
jgi:hypothetical protein